MRNANCKDLFFNKIYFEKFYSTKFWFKKVLVFVVIWSDCSKSMIHHNIYDGSTMKVQPGESIFSTPLIYCLSPHPMGWNSFWRGLMSPLSPAFSQVFINLKLSGAHEPMVLQNSFGRQTKKNAPSEIISSHCGSLFVPYTDSPLMSVRLWNFKDGGS